MTAKFRGDYDGIGRMLRSEEMQLAMADRAERIAEAARADAPVDETGPHPGRYRDSFEVTHFVRVLSGGDRRACGRVTNTAPEAVFVEFGSKNNDAHHTLLHAIDAARD